MLKALDPATRQAIEEAIRGGASRNQIARDFNVSGSTVTGIGQRMESDGDLEVPAFDRGAIEHGPARLVRFKVIMGIRQHSPR